MPSDPSIPKVTPAHTPSDSTSCIRLFVRVMKVGDSLGFGVRNNQNHPVTVSNLSVQNTSQTSLHIGDAIISVNGTNLSNKSFLEVVEFLKTTQPGELLFEVDRPLSMLKSIPQGQENIKQTSNVSDASRKRVRPTITANGRSTRQWENEIQRLEKQHRVAITTLSMELKKETTEKEAILERNNGLRKRLQQMLIECDDVRVQAKQAVLAIQEKTKKERQELERALQAATASLRLQDRGPDVTRTDSIIQELQALRMQLERMKKMETLRSSRISARFTVETRLAERQVVRVKEKMIELFRAELRVVARHRYGITGEGRSDDRLSIRFEGLQRLVFMKLFGLECTLEVYTSEAFYASTPIEHRIELMKQLIEVFGISISHEERTGVFLVVSTPMHIVYDPEQECATITCICIEQNQIRELARTIRI